jgi:signal transduction histidine kinase
MLERGFSGYVEKEYIRKDGSRIPVEVTASIVRGTNGRPDMIWCVIRDITERRNMERQLAESHRLAAIGETTATIGHDLRNPLQSVVSTVYLAKKKLESSEVGIDPAVKSDLADMLETIVNESQYMDKIVSDLQDYSAPLRAELVQADMQSLLNETLSKIRVPQNIKVSFTVSEQLPRLGIDPSMMRRAFTNLILNAIQAMPEGGELGIAISGTAQHMIVAFKDTGVGIPAENMGKLFSTFFTTKARGQGLGLAVCKRLVEAHGGTISVESQPGEGSTFTVKLPFKNG